MQSEVARRKLLWDALFFLFLALIGVCSFLYLWAGWVA
jgi:hypothetical protein